MHLCWMSCRKVRSIEILYVELQYFISNAFCLPPPGIPVLFMLMKYDFFRRIDYRSGTISILTFRSPISYRTTVYRLSKSYNGMSIFVFVYRYRVPTYCCMSTIEMVYIFFVYRYPISITNMHTPIDAFPWASGVEANIIVY